MQRRTADLLRRLTMYVDNIYPGGNLLIQRHIRAPDKGAFGRTIPYCWRQTSYPMAHTLQSTRQGINHPGGIVSQMRGPKTGQNEKNMHGHPSVQDKLYTFASKTNN